jgi:ubiquinone/menaquinone biosynthesis C-methylase UbiE
MVTSTNVADDWSAVAPAWDAKDEYVEDNTAAATEALLAAVAVQPGDRVLELATGAGTLGATWAQLAGPSGRIVLSDIAPGMVDVARRRNAHLPNAEVTVLDASAIARPDSSFDVVTCRMGLMFTPDPAVALGEIHRVLTSGGRFGALTWASIEHNPWMTCVGMATMANGLISGGPPVGPGGIFSLGDPTELQALVKGAGFVDVAVSEFPTTFHAESIDAHVDRVSALAGPLATALAGATAAQLAAVRRTAAQLASDYITNDGVALPGRALLVTGRT